MRKQLNCYKIVLAHMKRNNNVTYPQSFRSLCLMLEELEIKCIFSISHTYIQDWGGGRRARIKATVKNAPAHALVAVASPNALRSNQPESCDLRYLKVIY